MRLVLEPEDLRAGCVIFDEVCAALQSKGARFAPDILALKILRLVSQGSPPELREK